MGIEGRVVAIGSTRIAWLEQPMLASRYGGPVRTAPRGDALAPSTALFHVLT